MTPCRAHLWGMCNLVSCSLYRAPFDRPHFRPAEQLTVRIPDHDAAELRRAQPRTGNSPSEWHLTLPTRSDYGHRAVRAGRNGRLEITVTMRANFNVGRISTPPRGLDETLG